MKILTFDSYCRARVKWSVIKTRRALNTDSVPPPCLPQTTFGIQPLFSRSTLILLLSRHQTILSQLSPTRNLLLPTIYKITAPMSLYLKLRGRELNHCLHFIPRGFEGQHISSHDLNICIISHRLPPETGESLHTTTASLRTTTHFTIHNQQITARSHLVPTHNHRIAIPNQ